MPGEGVLYEQGGEVQGPQDQLLEVLGLWARLVAPRTLWSAQWQTPGYHHTGQEYQSSGKVHICLNKQDRGQIENST